MPIAEKTLIRIAEITKTSFDEWIESVIAELEHEVSVEHVEDIDVQSALVLPESSDESVTLDIPWSFEGIKLPPGGWKQVGQPDTAATYRWPDNSVDHYNQFVTYEGTGGKAGATLGLGYKNDETIGFVMGTNGWKRGLTVFWKADDFASSDEKLSMIKGGGPRGRSGFGPGDALPDAYVGFKTEMLGDRVTGKWNVQAVVAKADDHETMLDHTWLQAKLRWLV